MLLWVSHVASGRGLRTQTILRCLSLHLSGELNQKQSSLDSNQGSDVGFPGSRQWLWQISSSLHNVPPLRQMSGSASFLTLNSTSHINICVYMCYLLYPFVHWQICRLFCICDEYRMHIFLWGGDFISFGHTLQRGIAVCFQTYKTEFPSGSLPILICCFWPFFNFLCTILAYCVFLLTMAAIPVIFMGRFYL